MALTTSRNDWKLTSTKWLTGIPKLSWMVHTSVSGLISTAVLMRSLCPVPAMGTHRSRGMERIEALLEAGSRWMIMSVSLAPAPADGPPKARASAADLTNDRVSEPTTTMLREGDVELLPAEPPLRCAGM